MKPKADAGIKEMLLQRLLSFGLVVGVGFVLLVSLLVSAGLLGPQPLHRRDRARTSRWSGRG